MKLVMFDLDDTLTQSLQDNLFFEQALRQGLSSDDFSRDWASYRNVSEAGISRELANRIAPDSTERLVDRVKQLFIQRWETALREHPDSVHAIAGSNHLLNELDRRSGIALALATGTWSEAVAAKLSAAGLNLPPSMVIASCNDADSRVDIMKTALERAASRHNVHSFDQVFFVGDAIWDANACRELRWTFIALSGLNKAATLKEAGATAVFPDFTDTAAFLAAVGEPIAPSAAKSEHRL